MPLVRALLQVVKGAEPEPGA